jgi:hypothetical protein
MSRQARLTDALRGRGKALVFLGAAAAVAGAGTASAATTAHAATARPAALRSVTADAARSAVGSTARESEAVLTAAVVNAQRATETALQQAAKPTVKATAKVARKADAPRAAAPHAATAKHAAPARHPAPAKPYEIYDSVTPSQIPAHHEVATYATGAYAASPAQVAGRKVLWIDTTGGDSKANVLDVEPGDATPPMAATWAAHRLQSRPDALARIYTMRSEWPAVRAAIATLPAKMQAHVRWWIADPTGVPHIVPGAQATQWYWGQNYDISTATAQF